MGSGGMGTLCALIFADRGSRVTLWGRSSEHVDQLNRTRENTRYLPGHQLPQSVCITADARAALRDPSLVLCAVPTQYIRSVFSPLGMLIPPSVPILSVTKGIEVETLRSPTEILARFVGHRPLACLTGPCIAPEVAQRKPTSVVVAARDPGVATLVQQGMSTPYFRVYTSDDLLGAELAGAVKNVIAIAAGICDGLDLGCNAKASLITRGLVEITRLGTALGARPETFNGLAGVGDLMTTCMSPIGRNRSAGERIGRGALTAQVIASTPAVIEGIPTTQGVLELAKRTGVEMPIVSAVASMLFEGIAPRQAIQALMTRKLKSERSNE